MRSKVAASLGSPGVLIIGKIIASKIDDLGPDGALYGLSKKVCKQNSSERVDNLLRARQLVHLFVPTTRPLHGFADESSNFQSDRRKQPGDRAVGELEDFRWNRIGTSGLLGIGVEALLLQIKKCSDAIMLKPRKNAIGTIASAANFLKEILERGGEP